MSSGQQKKAKTRFFTAGQSGRIAVVACGHGQFPNSRRVLLHKPGQANMNFPACRLGTSTHL